MKNLDKVFKSLEAKQTHTTIYDLADVYTNYVFMIYNEEYQIESVVDYEYQYRGFEEETNHSDEAIVLNDIREVKLYKGENEEPETLTTEQENEIKNLIKQYFK